MKMWLQPNSVDLYRQSKQLPLVHQRKRCQQVRPATGEVCGATITAVELHRYGGCEKCWEGK